jgi:hypothetical protein
MTSGGTERDQRQYALMRETIDAFRDGRAIGPVIADLEDQLHALEDTPKEWKDSFWEEWAILEIAHAMASADQQPLPTARDHDIAAALQALYALLSERTGSGA